jgi:hypothetical protein
MKLLQLLHALVVLEGFIGEGRLYVADGAPRPAPEYRVPERASVGSAAPVASVR